MGKALAIVVVVMGIILAFASVRGNQSQSASAVTGLPTLELPLFTMQGEQAPAFAVHELQTGRIIELGHAGDRPVVLNFWASWCPPCRAEAPELRALYGKFRSSVSFVGIDITSQDSVESAKWFVKNFRVPFSVAIDPTGKVTAAYRVTAIPTTVVLSKSGVILDRFSGPINSTLLTRELQQLAATSAHP